MIFLFDRSQGNSNFPLWRSGLILELLSAALLKDTQNLGLSILSYASSRSQTVLTNLIPSISVPFSRAKCLTICESIEDSVYSGIIPTDTYSDVTMELVDKFVTKGRRTTIITIAGTVSNGNYQDSTSPDYTPGNIAAAIEKVEMKVGNPSLVKFFSAGYIGNQVGTNVNTRANYKTELKSLADEVDQRVFVNSNQTMLFTDLLGRLRLEGVLCSLQSKSVIHIVITSLFFQIIVIDTCIYMPYIMWAWNFLNLLIN